MMGEKIRVFRRTARRSVLFLVSFLFCAAGLAQDPEVVRQIDALVRDLNSPQADTRDEAETKLIKLGTPDHRTVGPRKLLEILPMPNDRMPPEMRHRLTRLRQKIEQADAEAAVAATRVTLQATAMQLGDVLANIEKQTGNRFIDRRHAAGQQAMQAPITIQLEDVPFWQAIDQVLDQASMTIYTFSGEDALIVQPAAPGALPRHSRGEYVGPFRIAPMQVNAVRQLDSEDGGSLNLQIQIAWEPRLQPIGITQPLDQVAATDVRGEAVPATTSQGTLDVPIHPGSQSAELQLMFPLPPRSVSKIAMLKGTLSALVPGREETFHFEDLANAESAAQRRGGVTVSLETVRKNGDLWEVHMRFALDETGDAMQSHLGWVLQNISYLVGADGEPIEHLGFERTHQTENEVGFVYAFELPDGKTDLSGIAWEYKTPAAIVKMPIEYTIENIPLP